MTIHPIHYPHRSSLHIWSIACYFHQPTHLQPKVFYPGALPYLSLQAAMAETEKKSIVVVGGGIIGCSTAYFLTRHPKYDPSKHSIHLIEATSIAAGASGKAGGLLALWAYPACLVPLSFRLHAELAKEHGGKDRWGFRGVGVGQIELTGRPVDDRSSCPPKAIDVASEGNAHAEQEEHVSLQKRSKASYDRLRRAGLPDDLDWLAEECVQGYDSMGGPEDTAQVHPYHFTTAMAELAQEKGVKVILGSVQAIESTAARSHTVKYSDKETNTIKSLQATDVVVAAGPWTGKVLPRAPIGALRAHSVTIRPSRPLSAYCLFTSIRLPRNFKAGVKSRGARTVTPEMYARPNNELYACGEGDHLVPLPESAALVEVDAARCRDIVDYCASVSDELRAGAVLARQACYLPQVTRGAGGPLVGRTDREGVYVAAGHTCWGIQNAPATGKLMSEFVFDGEPTSADVRSLDPRMVMGR